MKRLILAAFAALFLVTGLAHAGAGTWPSGLQTYVFRQGQSSVTGWTGPTFVSTGWTDNSLRYLTGKEDKNYGSDDSLMISPIANPTLGESMVVMKCDFLGSLQANFVITRARLGVYKISTDADATVAGVSDPRIVYVYRCMFPWVEGNGTGILVGGTTDAAFSSAHATGLAASWSNGDDQSIGQPNTDFWRLGTETGLDSSSVLTGGYWGADSLFNAASLATPANLPTNPEASFYQRVHSTGTTVTRYRGLTWIDVTHYCQGVAIGAIQNNGWVFTNSTSIMTKATYYASREHATIAYREILVIEGFTISAASSSSGGGFRFITG